MIRKTASLFVLGFLCSCALEKSETDPLAFSIPVKVTSRATTSIFAQPGKAVVRDIPRGGCFNGQLEDSAELDRIADATVQIVALSTDQESKDGVRSWIGSGFIVHNSAVDGQHNRIVTASHVVEDAIKAKTSKVGILSSSGQLFGVAHVVASADPFNQFDKEKHNFRRGDQVVLEIEKFAPDLEKEYNQIRGVDLAHEQAQNELKGLFNTPAGIAPGISGGPLFNKDGEVIAIASSKQDYDNDDKWQVTKEVQAGANVWNSGKHSFEVVQTKVKLPVQAWGFFEPINDPKILVALGKAATDVHSSADAPKHWQDVQVVGYPSQFCIVYKGSVDATR